MRPHGYRQSELLAIRPELGEPTRARSGLRRGERWARSYLRAHRGGRGYLLGLEQLRTGASPTRPLHGHQRGPLAHLRAHRGRRGCLLGRRQLLTPDRSLTGPDHSARRRWRVRHSGWRHRQASLGRQLLATDRVRSHGRVTGTLCELQPRHERPHVRPHEGGRCCVRCPGDFATLRRWFREWGQLRRSRRWRAAKRLFHGQCRWPRGVWCDERGCNQVLGRNIRVDARHSAR